MGDFDGVGAPVGDGGGFFVVVVFVATNIGAPVGPVVAGVKDAIVVQRHEPAVGVEGIVIGGIAQGDFEAGVDESLSNLAFDLDILGKGGALRKSAMRNKRRMRLFSKVNTDMPLAPTTQETGLDDGEFGLDIGLLQNAGPELDVAHQGIEIVGGFSVDVANARDDGDALLGVIVDKGLEVGNDLGVIGAQRQQIDVEKGRRRGKFGFGKGRDGGIILALDEFIVLHPADARGGDGEGAEEQCGEDGEEHGGE